MLKIRVSRPYNDLIQFAEKLSEACDTCVVYEHEADATVSRTHIHAYVENPKVSTDTMKNWVKKVLKTTAFPKADWSFTGAMDRGFITYLSKGELIPKFYKGIEKSELDLLRADWVAREQQPKKIQYVLKAENPEQQKMRQWEMVTEIRRRIHVRPEKETNDGLFDPHRVCSIIRDVVVVQNRTLCGRYKFRDYYDTVMALEGRNHNDMENFVAFKS